MKLPSTSIRNNQHGFTLIEMIIVIAIIGFLATMGIIIGLDSYQRYNFHSEVDDAVAMLQKARSEAINNIGGAPHGVYFDNSSSNLILFSGASYSGTYEFKIEKARATSYSAPACTSGNQIIFSQLSGETTGCQITITDGIRNSIITVNNEGGINW